MDNNADSKAQGEGAASVRRTPNAVTICVDADGGDNAPEVVTEGARMALKADPELDILYVGRESSVWQLAAEFPGRVKSVITTEVIEMADHPADAVRQKKDSSIVVGCKLVHEGAADGFFSAGSTGGVMTAATVLIGRIKGVKRPALGTVVPVPGNPVFLLDCGANADCKPEFLVQFAYMGIAYAKTMMDYPEPSVGLLNNGSEATKGSELAVAAHDLMEEQIPGFVGNVEGSDITTGKCNVIVADGFSGNIALKTMEGSTKMVFKCVKDVMTSSAGNKIAAAKLQGGIKELVATLDTNTYGGAPLLGTRKVCIKGHGSTTAEGVKNGILQCAKSAREDLPGVIASALEG